MNRFVRSASLVTLLLAAALPCAADPRPEDCGGVGETTLEGSLSTRSIGGSPACTRQQVDGVMQLSRRTTCADPGAPPEMTDVKVYLDVTSATADCDDGTTPTLRAVKGKVKFFNDAKGFGRTGAIAGVVDSNDVFVGTLEIVETKKGLNAVNVRRVSLAGLTGSLVVETDGALFSLRGHHVAMDDAGPGQ